MPVTRTLEFLPAVFQTETNKKFLNATLDQLMTEPKLTKINGYIGRKFAPTASATDSYIKEPTAARAKYQLEPSVVVRDNATGNILHHSAYPEVLQKLRYYGLTTQNQNSIWESEYYSYNPHIDYDKFINFSQYYWLPDGPDAVDVFAGSVDLSKTFTVTTDPHVSAYNFTGSASVPNPDIILARGGVYDFVVDQPGRNFWIQTTPGISGMQNVLTNLSSRDVYGVANNGTDSGTVSFTVPQKTDQDFYVYMASDGAVDYATTIKYSELQGIMLSDLQAQFQGIDGQYTESMLSAKYIIFNGNYSDDASWTADTTVVPENQRMGIWRIHAQGVDHLGADTDILSQVVDYRIDLTFDTTVSVNHKVSVKTGGVYGGTEWFRNEDFEFEQVPALTAILDTLYYQDSEDPAINGIIRLVDASASYIDVAGSILGKTAYTSPNGVTFTNGMKVRFDTTVTPATYQNREFYVEGVGVAITLTLIENLGDSYTEQDYIVINRSSLEKSQWSQGNRWFHTDVINLTAMYNGTVPVFDMTAQARRPIIEFAPNLQLFDFGSYAKIPVDLYDTTHERPFNTVEGVRLNSSTNSGFFIDGVELIEGMRIIFAADQDAESRNNVWVVSFETVGDEDGLPQVHLTIAEDGVVVEHDTVLIKSGIAHGGAKLWFNDGAWVSGQQKTQINQAPRFDVFDQSGISFGDRVSYPVVTVDDFFMGTEIFSYAVGTGVDDSVLGFPLSYRTVGNVGDIVFENDFDRDVFEYTIDQTKYQIKTNTGWMKKNSADGSYTWVNNWSKALTSSRQYQEFNFVYDGDPENNLFVIDVLPKEETLHPTLYVYLNGKLLSNYEYYIERNVNYNDDPIAGFRVYVDYNLIAAGDRVDVFVDSDSVSTTGSYEFPDTLELNPQNNTVQEFTLSDLRTHVSKLTASASIFSGKYPGPSNLRDLDLTAYRGNICQQSSNVPLAMLFLADENINLVESVSAASREYSRFKNRFLENATTSADIAFLTPAAGVDALMKTINAAKNKTMPWFYSDMVPSGDSTNIIEYTVFNPATKSYEITHLVDMTVASDKSVIVYYNGVQLIRGRDYTVSTVAPAIVIDDAFTLEVDKVLTIVEYNTTNGSYVPETPTKLGLYPKFTPEIFVDDTYLRPVLMIRGHDGSVTPAFTTLPESGAIADISRYDFRDLLLIELEQRIYNNIKSTYDEKGFGINSVIPGKFRNTGYSLQEFDNIILKFFLNWVGLNRLDYLENSSYQDANTFTWNFRNHPDRLDSEPLPGSWRACYEYYYDTATPHLTPWEMLGFSEKPQWWEDYYGPAPYTGGNLVMWQDLANGFIAAGDRQGIDQRYVRPNLLDVIPVDVTGILKSPEFLIKGASTDLDGRRSWTAGAFGPVETAWRNSSEYPYAVQVAMAIMKPGKYFGLNVDKNVYNYSADISQYISRITNQRITQTDIVINGHTGRASGYINWVADNLKQRGIDPEITLGSYLSDFEINMSYRMAGFSDKKYIKVLAEQYSPGSTNNSVLIPDSDYDLVLTKSTPVGKITYSAVIVERTSAGYRVSGYDTNTPAFTVIPPDPAGETHGVSVLATNVTIYKNYLKVRAVVPYGFEFTTMQQVSNFLIGYGVGLAAQGFKFDEYDSTLEQIKNWTLSVKEFLFWAQQGWKESSIIVLSPVGSSISSDVGLYAVDKVGVTANGGRVLNQNFQPIGNQSLSYTRLGNRFTCTAINQDMIGLIDLNLVQYEHTMIFKNVSMFNDVIYKPENGVRQYRLKLVGSKTTEWNGTLEAPGFMYFNGVSDEWQAMRDYLKGDTVQHKGIRYTASKDLPGVPEFNFSDWVKVENLPAAKLLPNFAQISSASETFYDADTVNLEDQYDLFGKGLIGYRNRNYLYSLGLDDASQVKFYQGFIKEKGTLNAFSALGNVSVGDNTGVVELHEEWAFRIGEFGALDINQTVDLRISSNSVLSNPFSVELTTESSEADVVLNRPYLSSAVDVPDSIFLNRDHVSAVPRLGDIQSVGFPELNDVDYTLFDINDFSSLHSELVNIGAGTKIWCANDFDKSWNVFRVVETNVAVTAINNALDNLIEMNTSKTHGLSVGDVVIVKNANQFSGLYKIRNVPTLRSFVVEYSGNLLGFSNTSGLSSTLFTLKSMVFDYAFQVAEYTPPNGWKETDVAWVRYDSKGKWGTYKKITPWSYVRTLPRGNVSGKELYGTSVNLSVDNQIAMVGNPSASSGIGEVVAYTRSYADRFRELVTFSSTAENTLGMGQILEQGNFWSIIGAPASGEPGTNDAAGYAFVAHRTFGSLDVEQVLVAPDYSEDANFGAAVSISQDDMWAAVGAPGVGKMYVYGLNVNTPERSFSITGDGATTEFILNFIPESIDSIVVRTDERLYLPYIDYTVAGATVEFTAGNTPALGVLVSVSQKPGYRLISTVTGSAAAQFGYSVAIATDGAQILASAPYEDVVTTNVVASTALTVGKRYQIAALGDSDFTLVGAASNTVGTQFTATDVTTGSGSTGSVYEVLVDAGAIYVYDRSVEAFVADGGTTFTPRRPILSVSKVTVNETTQVYGDDYVHVTAGSLTRVVFNQPPAIGATVAIETNEVNLIERVTADQPEAEDLLGYNINLCPTNCSLYAGLPMRSHGGKLNNGAVIRFFNTGRQSGNNIGVFLNPVTVTLYESVASGANTIKVAGPLTHYPLLQTGLRIRDDIQGLPKFATVTSIVQTTSTYFTITISEALTGYVPANTDVTFERVPRVSVGNTIRINDFEVDFTNSELDDVVAAINNKNIPGVVAVNNQGYLELISNVLVTRRRLRVMAGKVGSTAIQDLGLRVYPQIQFITNPYDNDDKMFGKKVRITRALPDFGFLVGSDTASTYIQTTFDSRTTTFDRTSTNIQDQQPGSGAVYMFTFMGDDRSVADFPAGKLAFAQQFVPAKEISAGLRYGTDFDIQDNRIIIGAPEVDTYGSGAKGTAQVYEFVNTTDRLGWTLSSYEDTRVDIDAVNKLFLWNKDTNVITTTLDYIDPAKGKILGSAEQEIKYKTAYDPAMYNRGDSSVTDINEALHWTNKQVGQVWWDLSKVRYVDYEHGSVTFRTANWGAMFPGSSIDVYEWVESIYLPSEYVANGGNGTPMHADDSAYVSISVVDALSDREYNKYYYWVKDKTTVEYGTFGRTMPVARVAELIENPRGQDVKFAAVIKDTAVALYNCSDDIKGNDIVLHIDYDTQLNSSIVHSEWELVKESSTAGFAKVPDKILNKMLDSLSGLDSYGNVVPDPLLPVQNRYGIGVRPRQGMFINQSEAVRTLVKYLNDWFKTIPLSLSFNIETLSNKEPYPPANSGAWETMVPNIETLGYLDTVTLGTGYRVLVENDSGVSGLWTIYELQDDLTWFLARVQSYDDTPYWSYVDWYAEGYDETTVPRYVVNTYADLSSLTYVSGDVVRVLNDGTGKFRLLEMLVGEVKTIGLQDGTVQFADSLYNLADYGMGWNNGGFGATRFDQNPSIELRKMLTTLFGSVFVESYQSQYGKVLQNLVNYILTEQKSVEWMFKTNFVSVLHKLRKLTQPAVYSKDNQETYLEYLNEVKPYSATVREYVVDYEGADNVNGYITDFDVPSSYDAILRLHRSPSGEYYQDRAAINGAQYTDWKFNYPYSIAAGTDSIVLHRPGKGYISKPNIVITGSNTGDDAQAVVVSLSNGQISAISVTEVGTNYTGFGVGGVALPVSVTITGGGLPDEYVAFESDLMVAVDDVIKTSSLQYFKVTQAGTLGYAPVTTVDGERWETQNVGDLVYSGTTILEFLGEEAVAHAVLTNNNIRKVLPKLAFDRVTYSGKTVNIWQPSTQYYAGDVVYYRGAGYQATADFVSNSVFTLDNLETYYLTANDRISAFYQSSIGAAGNDPALLQSGINYPGVYITGPKFSDDPGFDNNTFDLDPFDNFELDSDGTAILGASLMDSLISSQFTDDFFTALTDSRPDGIVIDGGEFVDVYNSHAPEELIPGRVHEAVDIQVYQTISPPAAGSTAAQGPDIQLTAHRVGDQPSRMYGYGNNHKFNDKLFVYSKTRGRLQQGSDYNIDYYNQRITLLTQLGDNDVVFIYALNQVGINKQHDVIYAGTGTQQSFSTQFPSNSDIETFVQVDGVTVTNYTLVDNIFDNTQYVEFSVAPAADSYIHIMVFNTADDMSGQQWSEIYTQTHQVPANYGQSVADYTILLDTPVFNRGPFGAQVIVELNTLRLRPASCAYHNADGSNDKFELPVTDLDIASAITDNTMPINDISVYVNGTKQEFGVNFLVGDETLSTGDGVETDFSVNIPSTIVLTAVVTVDGIPQVPADITDPITYPNDYSIVSVGGVNVIRFVSAPADESDIRILTFRDDDRAGTAVLFNEFSVPGEGSDVVVEVNTFAKVIVSDLGDMVTIKNTNITATDIITIDTFSNHDILGIETRTYVGGQTYTTEIPIGFDQLAFDQGPMSFGHPNIPDAVYSVDDVPPLVPEVSFDTNGETTLVVAKFNLERDYTNLNYLWITLDGRRLMPVYDFIVDGQYLYINPVFTINSDSVLIVTSFASSTQTGIISYRQFRGITGKTEYLRMPLSASTALLESIDATSTNILVESPGVLPTPGIHSAIPGVIFINGERITYFRNYVTEPILSWEPDTNYELQTLVSYAGETYDVVGDVNGSTFEDIESNLVLMSETTLAHGLGQIRRGTAGTGATYHAAGTILVDGSAQQLIPDASDQYAVAKFVADGIAQTFSTVIPAIEPDPMTLYITQDQVDGIEQSIMDLGLSYTLTEYTAQMIAVYVGGMILPTSAYSVDLVSDTYNGETVYTFDVTISETPVNGLWVAVELRTGNVWFDIGIVDELAPTTSALALSSTNQAKFLKEELGILL